MDNVRSIAPAMQAIAPALNAVRVPEPLMGLPGWLIWKFEHFVGEAKPRKIPYWADGTRRHGQQGGPQDRDRLTTFVAARDAAVRAGFDGVGFAPLADFGSVFLDFDNCVDVHGNMPNEITQIVGRTYAEYSPSGKGIRAALRGDLGNHKSHATPDQYGFETFSSTGFVTFTGNILPICDLLGYEDRIAPVDDFTQALCEKRFGATSGPTFDPDDFMAGREPKLGLTVAQMEEYLSYLDPSMGREAWLRVGMALHHECDGDDTGFTLWDEWSSDGDTYPGTEGLQHQWDSLKPSPGRRQVTMASVIKMAKDAGYRSPSQTVNRDEVLAKAEAMRADLPQKSVGRFGPVPIYDVTQREPMSWFIKSVLPKGELGILYGASGSGKTFVALDLAFAIARGTAWRERRTAKGRVVIIAAEGGSGIGKRAKAYAQHHGFDLRGMDDLQVITAAPNFLDSDDISEVIAEITNIGPVDLVVIDTLAQVTPGANENTSEDMGRALANLKLLHEATGAMNLVVHHAGKDLTRGSRGWSGLKAAADVQLEVLRHDNGDREIILDKMKDGEDGVRFAFKLEVIELGVDLEGDIITSCVAVEAERVAQPEQADRKGVKKRGRYENHVLEVMALFGEESVVSTHELIEKAVADMPLPEAGKRDIRRQSVVRAINSLSREKDGPLQIKGGKVIFYE